jgi:hypothetical protein
MMSIDSLSPNYLQSILTSSIQGTGLSNSASTNTASTSATSTVTQDGGRLSPFAQMLSQLQQLQQSGPTRYAQVTAQISTNLEKASQTAVADGNSTAAVRLDQLSKDFSDASKSGQLPNIQDLPQAVAGNHRGHGHHHHHVESSSDPDAGAAAGSSTSSTASSSTDSNSPVAQLWAAFQSGQSGSDLLNPVSIIMNTLSQAGIGQS